MSDPRSTPDDAPSGLPPEEPEEAPLGVPEARPEGEDEPDRGAGCDARHPERGRAARGELRLQLGRDLTACRSGVVSLACSRCWWASCFLPRSSGVFALLAMWLGAETRPWFDERPVLDDRPNWWPIRPAPAARWRRGRSARAPTSRATARRAAGWPRRCGVVRAQPGGRDERGDQPVGRVIGGLEVGLVAELAQRGARDRPDRDQARAVERARPRAWKKRADGRAREGQRSRRPARPRAPRRRSGSAHGAVERERRRPRSRRRAARRARRRAPPRRARRARAGSRAAGQRLDQRLADGALGHDVGLDAARAQRRGRARADRRRSPARPARARRARGAKSCSTPLGEVSTSRS